MFYHELIMHRCKRFSLRGVNTLTIRPTLKTQMVLGSNGAGKSSLLKIGFSVTLAQASDYHKGGYKSIALTHNGHYYVIKTIFEKASPEHSFICDEEELNIGHTGAVQKELVREHFSMTQEIHDVLTGEKRFTSMSPLERRDWITRLSSTDFSYVLSFFSKVKKAASDANVIVKRNTARLGVESTKLMDQSELDVLINRSKEFRAELDVLLLECNNSNTDVQMVAYQLKEEFSRLELLLKKALQKCDLTPPDNFNIISMDDLNDKINHHRKIVIGFDSSLGELGNIFQHYERQMEQLKSIEGMDEDFIRSQIVKLENGIKELTQKLKTGLGLNQIVTNHHDANKIEEFRAMLYDISPYQNETYQATDVETKRQTVNQLHTTKNQFTIQLGNLEGRLDHIGQCQETACPKCNHQFKVGVVEGEQEKLKASQSNGLNKLKQVDEQLIELTEFLNGADGYYRVINNLQRFRQSNPQMSGFWTYLDQKGGLDKGRELVPEINLYMADVTTAIALNELEEQLRPLRESIQSIEKLGGEKQGIREQFYTYKAKIEDINSKIRDERDIIDQLETYQSKQQRFDREVNDIRSTLIKLDGLQEHLIESIRQSEIKGLIRDDQISLAMIENTLTESEIQAGIVNDIRKEIDAMVLEEKAFTMLTNILSPKDGLIAEQISIFINAIIERMNAVIARIWGYNMAIKPCDVTEDGLDYKFPLYTVAEANEVADVSKGSTSQIDIVNQAFRLVVYKFLNLNGYPLYLDELGSSFDEVHRHNLVPAIKDLIDDSTYSQIFMISHYADGQNSYPNSEITVLDENHISLKRKYNEHVIFE